MIRSVDQTIVDRLVRNVREKVQLKKCDKTGFGERLACVERVKR